MKPAGAILALTLLLTACYESTGVLEAGAVPVDIAVVAGPTCPVQTDPPDPACADQPVAGAVIEIELDGTVMGRLVADDQGVITVELTPGNYRLVPQPVEGLLGTASPVDLVIESAPQSLVIPYDTGIR